jgi:hypothetical protein
MINPAFVPLEHVVASQLEDGDGVLVDLNTRQYYQLNESAMLIWRGLESGYPLSKIVEELVTTYAVSNDRAVVSAETVLRKLQDRKLVEPSKQTGSS